MSSSHAVLKFCLHQENLIEVLQRISDSLSQAQTQIAEASFRGEKVSKRLDKLRDGLTAELRRLQRVLQDSRLNQLEIRARWDAFAQRARLFSQTLTVMFENNREEWAASLASGAARATELSQEIRSLDLRGAFGHVADAVLVDHYANLGEKRVLQWPRKIWHVFAGLLIIGIYLFVPTTFPAKMTVFGAVTLSLLIGECFRLTMPNFNGKVMRWLRPYMRKREVHGCSSMTFYALSSFLVCAFFTKGVAILAILFLAFGDSIASIVGTRWGRHRLGMRFSVEGSIAFFLTAFGLTFLYPLLVPNFQGSILLFATLGGLIGMTSEWVSYRLDDNLVIPLFSAVFLSLSLLIV